MIKIANACPSGNTQEDFADVEALVIHGPTWTDWMPWDAHARTVIMPYLLKNKWEIRVSQGLRRIEAITPWRPDVLQ